MASAVVYTFLRFLLFSFLFVSFFPLSFWFIPSYFSPLSIPFCLIANKSPSFQHPTTIDDTFSIQNSFACHWTLHVLRVSLVHVFRIFLRTWRVRKQNVQIWLFCVIWDLILSVSFCYRLCFNLVLLQVAGLLLLVAISLRVAETLRQNSLFLLCVRSNLLPH